MSEGLREFDDSVGRCFYCNKLIFKKENFCIPFPFINLTGNNLMMAHKDCESENMRRMSQI